MDLIIIGCCARKNIGGTLLGLNTTFFEQNEQVPDLKNAREYLLQQHPPYGVGEYMKAWDRYDGTVYRKLKQRPIQDKIDFLRAAGKLEILIVSALYGVINYDTPINDYNLKMTDQVNNRTLTQYWQQGHVLANAINTFVRYKGIKNVFTFLTPNTYYNSISEGLVDHQQSWAVVYHGAINVLNHLTDECIIPKIEEMYRNDQA